MNSTKEIRIDSAELMSTFAAIANYKTGIGTGRSKTESGGINTRLRLLTRQELEVLTCQDDLVRRAVQLYPESAVNAWFKIHIANSEQGDNLSSLILKYLSDLGDREDITPEEQSAEIYGAEEAFLIASILARQFGKAYILMGIDDARPFDAPVDKANVRSLRWLQVYDRWEMVPDYEKEVRRTPNYYRLESTNAVIPFNGQRQLQVGQRIHKSRLLPFYGNRVYSRQRWVGRGGRDDGISVIQGMFDAYSDWIQGLKAGSAMLADYDTFTLGMKGLGELMLRDRRAGTTVGQEAVMNRALAIDEGKSVVRGILYDLENESPGSVTRSYGGAKDIMDSLEARWIAITGIPRFKLFGETGSQGLSNSNTAGLAARSEWAILTQVWSTNTLVGNMNRLTKIAFLAKDAPSKGVVPDNYDVVAPFDPQKTETERIELEKLAAERSQVLVNIKAITPNEVRSGYQGNQFTTDILLDSKEIPKDASSEPAPPNQPESTRADSSEILTDDEWDAFADISAADYIEVAKGVAKTVQY